MVTIVDDDSPAAVYSSCLGRFGRSAAQNVVDSVQERIRDASFDDYPGGRTASITSPRQFAPQDSSMLAEDPRSANPFAEDVVRPSDYTTTRSSHPAPAFSIPKKIRWHSQSPTDSNDLTWALCGRMSKDRFDGHQHDLEITGNVSSNSIGFDTNNDKWLVGTIISSEKGDGSLAGQFK